MSYVDTNEWFCTVFPKTDNEYDMPQDFNSWEEADEYGRETFGDGNYEIESPC